ncbi:aprataxin isoform X2 [Prorops nasuta]
MGLLNSMADPKCIIKEDDTVVVIKDKYPKAQHHFLVLPKINIPSIRHISQEHNNLLFHMDKIANDIVQKYKEYKFLIGYHAMPSMHRLHLHIISSDFNSPCLKTKHHWNSFNTPYFIPSKEIVQQLKESGKIQAIAPDKCKEYLLRPLRCHKCSERPETIRMLKQHLLAHVTQKE